MIAFPGINRFWPSSGQRLQPLSLYAPAVEGNIFALVDHKVHCTVIVSLGVTYGAYTCSHREVYVECGCNLRVDPYNVSSIIAMQYL